jgi:hypothetical protein
LIAVAAVQTLALSAQAAVIISDPLTGSGTVANSAPAVDTYNAGDVWAPGNGTFPRTASGAAIAAGTTASLQFTPAAGSVYTLQVTFSDGAGTNGNWAYMGFAGNTGGEYESPGPWALLRVSAAGTEAVGAVDAFASDLIAAGNLAGDGSTNHTLAIVLDTTEAQWSAAFERDGIEFATYQYTTNPATARVRFGTYGDATATAVNFALSEGAAVPEPASLGLLGLGGLALLRRKRA